MPTEADFADDLAALIEKHRIAGTDERTMVEALQEALDEEFEEYAESTEEDRLGADNDEDEDDDSKVDPDTGTPTA